jgi:hypothetical protein
LRLNRSVYVGFVRLLPFRQLHGEGQLSQFRTKVFSAAPAGTVVSAVLRGSVRLRRPTPRAALRHLSAGAMMGAGAILIPGGNDGLILFGLPALSPHALPAWLAIVAGIFVTLAVMRLAGGTVPRVHCRGDVCHAIS